MANSGTNKEAANSGVALAVGTYVAYGEAGDEIYREEDYEIGGNIIPTGISMGMKAMKIVHPKTGEVLKTWNPWGVL